MMDRIWLQTWLQSTVTTPIKKINVTVYFKILIVGLSIIYVPNMHVKFPTNWMLWTIRSINMLFFMYNFTIT